MMFKIFIVWRTLKIEVEQRAEIEKAQIYTIQMAYSFLWFMVWLIQKFFAHQKQYDLDQDQKEHFYN